MPTTARPRAGTGAQPRPSPARAVRLPASRYCSTCSMPSGSTGLAVPSRARSPERMRASVLATLTIEVNSRTIMARSARATGDRSRRPRARRRAAGSRSARAAPPSCERTRNAGQPGRVASASGAGLRRAGESPVWSRRSPQAGSESCVEAPRKLRGTTGSPGTRGDRGVVRPGPSAAVLQRSPGHASGVPSTAAHDPARALDGEGDRVYRHAGAAEHVMDHLLRRHDRDRLAAVQV